MHKFRSENFQKVRNFCNFRERKLQISKTLEFSGSGLTFVHFCFVFWKFRVINFQICAFSGTFATEICAFSGNVAIEIAHISESVLENYCVPHGQKTVSL